MSNDELQRAIDDITSSDNNAVAPVSMSNDTATVSLPEDMDNAQLKYEEASIPTLDETKIPEVGENPAVAAAPTVEDTFGGLEKTEANQAMEIPSVPVMPEPTVPDLSGLVEKKNEGAEVKGAPSEIPTDLPSMAPETEVKMPELSEGGPNDPQLKEVETAALLELYPLLSKMNVNAREKFDICMKVIEKTGERGATSAALDAAKEISDEKERGECLVKLVEAIDKMD